jgi:hypothetical protein
LNAAVYVLRGMGHLSFAFVGSTTFTMFLEDVVLILGTMILPRTASSVFPPFPVQYLPPPLSERNSPADAPNAVGLSQRSHGFSPARRGMVRAGAEELRALWKRLESLPVFSCMGGT